MGLEVMKMRVLRFKNMGFDTDMQDLKGQKKQKHSKHWILNKQVGHSSTRGN
jgi:hypothetical protein